MVNLKERTPLVFLALLTIITHTTVPKPPNTSKRQNYTCMADNLVSIRQHNRARCNMQRGGGRGGRGGRPDSPGRGLQQKGIPSCNEATFNALLEVLLILEFYNITVVVVHVKHDGCGFISKIKTSTLRLS